MKICFVLFALLLFGKAGAQSVDTNRVRPLGSNKIIVDKLKVQTIVTASDTLRLQPGIDTAEAMKYIRYKQNPSRVFFSLARWRVMRIEKVFTLKNHLLTYHLSSTPNKRGTHTFIIILLIMTLFPWGGIKIFANLNSLYGYIFSFVILAMIESALWEMNGLTSAYQLSWIDRYGIGIFYAVSAFLICTIFLITENIFSKKKKGITVL